MSCLVSFLLLPSPLWLFYSFAFSFFTTISSACTVQIIHLIWETFEHESSTSHRNWLSDYAQSLPLFMTRTKNPEQTSTDAVIYRKHTRQKSALPGSTTQFFRHWTVDISFQLTELQINPTSLHETYTQGSREIFKFWHSLGASTIHLILVSLPLRMQIQVLFSRRIHLFPVSGPHPKSGLAFDRRSVSLLRELTLKRCRPKHLCFKLMVSLKYPHTVSVYFGTNQQAHISLII